MRIKYEHASTGPDDFMHLMNYARLAFRKMMVVEPQFDTARYQETLQVVVDT